MHIRDRIPKLKPIADLPCSKFLVANVDNNTYILFKSFVDLLQA